MDLLEYQAKEILSNNRIPVPESKLIEMASDLKDLVYPVFLKAQIPVGGRGKVGAVRLANNRVEAEQITADLFGTKVKGYIVNTLLAEAAADIKREIYMCCINNKENNSPMLIVSKKGGVDIELLASESPEKIICKCIEPFVGLMEYDLRDLAAQLDIPCDKEFFSIVKGIWNILRTQDATLVEINPLAVTDKGLLALDGKIILDDNAEFRNKVRWSELKANKKDKIVAIKSESEKLAEKYQISFVPLDGDIGIIADGAGTGMLTLDLVKDLGGKPANFCEMGGKAAAEAAEQAMEIVLANPRVKSMLISLIGGLTRMDEVAEGIDAYLRRNTCEVPIAVRMCGTKAEEGSQILLSHGIEAKEDLYETAKMAVHLGGS